MLRTWFKGFGCGLECAGARKSPPNSLPNSDPELAPFQAWFCGCLCWFRPAVVVARIMPIRRRWWSPWWSCAAYGACVSPMPSHVPLSRSLCRRLRVRVQVWPHRPSFLWSTPFPPLSFAQSLSFSLLCGSPRRGVHEEPRRRNPPFVIS